MFPIPMPWLEGILGQQTYANVPILASMFAISIAILGFVLLTAGAWKTDQKLAQVGLATCIFAVIYWALGYLSILLTLGLGAVIGFYCLYLMGLVLWTGVKVALGIKPTKKRTTRL